MKLKYFEELKKSMEYLGKNKNVVFLGQAVKYPGTAMYNTLTNVPKKKRIELPVAEEMQMGMTVGFLLGGKIPVSIFPRFNFLLSGINQLVNHLDKLKEMTGQNVSKAIIRTSIGSVFPLNPQCQHVGDYSKELRSMCKNINVVRLTKASMIFKEYKKAFLRKDNVSTILVEFGDYYSSK
jgi:pyruvate/2-oxoglutarate/acetoin dehydrogenase E1 component|tara:strand:+ start:393 stop:932 length:540 start_codon:yes stop_codon:yes gene_type:complete